MTEQNPFARKMCGNPKIVTHLPIMIQIKFKTDRRKRSSLCRANKYFGRNEMCYPSGKIKLRWGTSDSTKSSESVGDSAKDTRKQDQSMRNNSNRKHSDKWNIFDRVPFRHRNIYNEHVKKSRTSSQFSSDESVCKCDELVTDDKSLEREILPRYNRSEKLNEHVTRAKLKKSSNAYSTSKNHSQSGKYLKSYEFNRSYLTSVYFYTLQMKKRVQCHIFDSFNGRRKSNYK